MKILFVRRGIYPGTDFPEVHQYSEELVKQGDTVNIVCLGAKDQVKEEVVKEVKVIRLGVNTSRLDRWLYPIKVWWYLIGCNYDIAHVFWGKGLFLIPFLARKTAKCWIIDVRSGHIGDNWEVFIVNKLIVFESYFFDQIITLDRHLSEKIWGKFGWHKNVSYVPMGVNLGIFRDSDSSRLREKLEISRDEFVFIYQGTLDKSRNLENLISAFNIAKFKLVNFRVLFVGGGNDKINLEALTKEYSLQNKIKFIGKVGFSEVPKYISLSDVGISYVPQVEKFKNQHVTKTLEYLACKVPVLATRIPFHESLLTHEDGVLCDDTPDKVAEGITNIVEKVRQKEMVVKLDKLKTLSWSHIVRNKLRPIYVQQLSK